MTKKLSKAYVSFLTNHPNQQNNMRYQLSIF